jgi:hypothetical protein
MINHSQELLSRFLRSLPGPVGIQRALGTWSTSGSFPYRSIRVSTEAPSTLHKLLMQSLLKNEALAVSAVDYLPGFLPSAPKEDLACRSTEILKTMV